MPVLAPLVRTPYTIATVVTATTATATRNPDDQALAPGFLVAG